ncbi:MAG: hypothetical protein LUE09_13905 [Synergistaceae bacterium]|nr:hypothetical protein [Synergistaceae bacterium]
MKKKAPRRGLIFMLSFMAFVLILTFGCLGTEAAAAGIMKIAVTSPWLYEVASFVGGRQAQVRVLSSWNEAGNTVVTGRPRAGELVVAFDPDDAARLKIGAQNKNLRLLYQKRPMSEDKMRAAFFDPSMMPFIAQEIMRIMAAADQKNYSYYQRRLAEFQSRIDSTMGIGRHLLAGVNMLDLTGAEGTWVRSSITGVVRPPESVWAGWLAGDSVALRAALDEASRRGWLLLLDPWTPEAIRSAATDYHYRLTLPLLPKDTEFFVFLHEILTIIANRVKAGARRAKM